VRVVRKNRKTDAIRWVKLLKIGERGVAYACRGIQESLQRQVAIKLLIDALSRDERGETPVLS